MNEWMNGVYHERVGLVKKVVRKSEFENIVKATLRCWVFIFLYTIRVEAFRNQSKPMENLIKILAKRKEIWFMTILKPLIDI